LYGGRRQLNGDALLHRLRVAASAFPMITTTGGGVVATTSHVHGASAPTPQRT